MSQLLMPVEEFTTPNPVTATEDADITELVSLMKANGIRHLPIVRGSKVVGIISDRDLRLAAGLYTRGKMEIKAHEIMVVEPITVSAETSLDEVAFEMSKNKIGSVIVNDENDNFLGIFTATDALNALIEIARAAQGKSNF